MAIAFTKRASPVSLAGLVMATIGVWLTTAGPIWAGGIPPTCDYIASEKKVRVHFTGSNEARIDRDQNGKIRLNLDWCERKATVFNTDRITVLAGDGTHIVYISLQHGGLSPGATDERGNSDEIEISVSLGGGDNDILEILGDDVGDKVVFGRSSGIGVLGRVNLNAYESGGDADLTIVIGVEEVRASGNAGSDELSGAGGAGTGEKFAYPLVLAGNSGSDLLIGGTRGDKLYGYSGDDTLRGGEGADFLYTKDNVSGNDAAFGGTGSDTCQIDPGDSKTSC
jgi:Ca2+-binding RTX toxin-like protein